jgi:hypothetical protein
MPLLALLLVLVLAPAAAAAQCRAESGSGTAALVELYTSEGCDSCPPADRWLSSLGRGGLVPERLVPIALHVDYRNYIGWKDPYARRAFFNRQRKMAALARSALVYTPQILLQGREFRGWGTRAFDAAVARINARPALARIALMLAAPHKAALEVSLLAELLDPVPKSRAAAYLAAFENKLVSQVAAGENRGRTLDHDFVVLEWVGPLEFGASPRIAERRSLPLLPKAVPQHSGVVAFVQDRSSGEVLQALMLPVCPG